MSTSNTLAEGSVNLSLDAKGIATISFFHPSHNSLPGALLQELAETIRAAGTDPAIKVIILKSEGERTFCAGASFDELMAIETKEQGLAFFSGFAKVINACRTSPRMILGRVQGKAIGGGVGVAASTDYCFATKHAAVKLSELALGIGPFVVGPAVERKIGLAAFSQLSLDAAEFQSAEWAKERGLYAEVFDNAGEMDAALHAFATRLAGYSPEALTAMKRVFWQGTEHWDQLLVERAGISGTLVLSDFTREFIKSFKAK
ncbi:enoyl-CoA hydratase/isomerase family protein [Cesiribacter andamanensis]|uniref:Putative polyketide biosynthesis enoyl-CoA hydratase pksH n=1 Tax=Cesiribacter andamanensis AMV16 TaxID=1279009 RepID=M7N7Q7_9BACT|nr:enoyl-CoA hydratase/isomerase family protein [Cesiribacter andamanensis]EMR03267.1 putative polyketide biosynthesis enoyl-CoA hydratase pksH [Cesiribacter andamanensis AMV16]